MRLIYVYVYIYIEWKTDVAVGWIFGELFVVGQIFVFRGDEKNEVYVKHDP